jgi:hypothetical protein
LEKLVDKWTSGQADGMSRVTRHVFLRTFIGEKCCYEGQEDSVNLGGYSGAHFAAGGFVRVATVSIKPGWSFEEVRLSEV